MANSKFQSSFWFSSSSSPTTTTSTINNESNFYSNFYSNNLSAMNNSREEINSSSSQQQHFDGENSILDMNNKKIHSRMFIRNIGGGALNHSTRSSLIERNDEGVIAYSPLPSKNSTINNTTAASPTTSIINNSNNSTTDISDNNIQSEKPSSSQLLYMKLSKNLLAGGLARCGAAIIMFPIDVVKTRLQFQRVDAFKQGKLRHHYKHGIDAFTTILKEEGVRGLYKGISVRLIYITPAAAVSFTVYEQFMKSIQGRLSSSDNSEERSQFSWTTPLLTLSAGLLARIFGTACRTPFDIVKQQLQVEGQLKLNNTERNLRSGIIGTAKNIVKQDGFSGFFSGYYVTLLRDAPFAAIYFTSYETIKRMLSIKQQQHEISTDELAKKRPGKSIHHLFSGALAGAIGTTCTIPVDVVKTRLQTQSKTGIKEYDGVIDAFRKIYKQEGLSAFSRGLGPRLTYIMPASALTFTLYERLKLFFNIEESTNTSTESNNSSA